MNTLTIRALAALGLLAMMTAVATARLQSGSLHEAASAGDGDMVVAVLRAGAAIDDKDADGHTPLMLAAVSGHADVVRILAGAGASIAMKSNAGLTAEELATDDDVRRVISTIAAADAERSRPAYVRMKTSMGEMIIELDREKAPISVANFLAYVDDEYYDGTIFHRIMDGFMIQGGGFTEQMQKKTTKAPIKNEWQNGLKNDKYTLSMARLGGQADSATSQFFINVVDNTGLDQPRDGAAYAVFGRVVKGMEVVDAIKAVSTTTTGQYQNVPAEPVIIMEVRVVEAPATAG